MFLRFWASFHSGLEGQYWFQTNFRRGGNGLILGKTVTEKTCFLGILYVLKSREVLYRITDFTWQVVQCIYYGFWLLTRCVNLGPLRSMCQEEIRNARNLLGKTSMMETGERASGMWC